MARVTYTDHEGRQQQLEGAAGDSVMELAVRSGLDGIVGECGGSLSCATCHVFLDPADADQVDPVSEMEDEMLWGTAVERREDSRLSCQLTLTEDSDLHVTTPEDQG